MENFVTKLNEEHQNILRVINLINKETGKLTQGQEINKFFWQKAVAFIRNYADKFHHAKEEDLLFKEMCQKSVDLHCNPIDQMLYEHNLGRDYVKGIEAGLKNNDKQEIIANANKYCLLLTEHIFKEDNILYPLAEQALSQEVKDSLIARFMKAEEEKFNKNEIAEYLLIIKEFTNE